MSRYDDWFGVNKEDQRPLVENLKRCFADIDARLKNIESALRVPGLPTELRPGMVPNAILELSERLSALEVAQKPKLSDEEIQRYWEAMIKRVDATPLQQRVEPTAPPTPRGVKMQVEAAASEGEPGWYPYLNGPSPISRNQANEVTDHQTPPQTRQPGWYWVKWRRKYEWQFGGWLSCGEWVKPNTPGLQPAPDVIGPRIQEPEE